MFIQEKAAIKQKYTKKPSRYKTETVCLGFSYQIAQENETKYP